MKSFSSFHPVVLFVYYVLVFCITISTMNPIILGCSLVGSILFFAMLHSIKFLIKEISFYFFVFLLVAITNPIFVHNGETPLFFLNDNPVTLEAVAYGIAFSTLLIALIFWSKSYNEIVSTDKFIYLFGRVIPKLSVWLSILFRFIPLFKKQFKKVNQAQKTLGFYTNDSITDRIIGSIIVFQSTFLWSIENTVSLVDSMKSRGYGLKGRSNFSNYTWRKGDFILSLCLFLLGALFTIFFYTFSFYYYPKTALLELSPLAILQYLSVLLLMIIPTIIEVKENIQWRFLMSKI